MPTLPPKRSIRESSTTFPFSIEYDNTGKGNIKAEIWPGGHEED